jgi:ribonuclease PH
MENSVRKDGRRSDELRPVRLTTGYVRYPEGSVLIEMGETRVLCNVTIEEKVPERLRGTGRGWVTAEYALLPRSTMVRTPRETHGLGGRTQEIRRLIGRSLRAAVRLDRIGERTFTADCDVLQADGGTRTAAITGAYVALVLALRRQIAAGVVPPDALGPAVAAVSVGMLDGSPLLDLNYVEDSSADVDLNVVVTSEGRYIEVQGTAEGRPFARTDLDLLLDLANVGIGRLLKAQQQALDGKEL